VAENVGKMLRRDCADDGSQWMDHPNGSSSAKWISRKPFLWALFPCFSKRKRYVVFPGKFYRYKYAFPTFLYTKVKIVGLLLKEIKLKFVAPFLRVQSDDSWKQIKLSDRIFEKTRFNNVYLIIMYKDIYRSKTFAWLSSSCM